MLAMTLAAGAEALGASILMAGETLRVHFQLAPPVCWGGPCDTLLVMPTADQAFAPTVDAVTLFHGQTVLGSLTGIYTPAFASSGSLMSAGAAIVDFTSVLDGSIQGSLAFSLSSGSMGWTNGMPGLNIVLGRALAPGLIMEGTAVVITGVTIHSNSVLAPEALDAGAVHNPEPGSLWLGAGGGTALWLLRRYRRGWST